MLLKEEKIKLENMLYDLIKESIDESDFFGSNFMQYEEHSSDDDTSKKSSHDEHHESGKISLADYDEKKIGTDGMTKLKELIPVLTNTYDDDVHTFNLTHSQLSYEMYPNLDPDVARSKFSQKVTGKKNFTKSEINKLSNIISGKIA